MGGWYHQGRAAKLLGVRRREVGQLIGRGQLRGERISDGNGGTVWAVSGQDVDRLRASPFYRHARDIPDVVMLRAIAEAQRAMFGVAMRPDVTRILGGLPPEAPVPSDRVPGVPWRLVLAKFRRVAGRGLVTGCDCGCRGDWTLTEAGVRLLREDRA
uniref:Helix-turn-helix DNA binding domain n=1 Tax=Mycobacterium phage Pharb TaxID=3136626 RepID=A0AAU8GSQ2_9VIRU